MKVVIVSCVHHFSVPNDGPMAPVPDPTGQVDRDHCRATFGSWIAKRTSFTHVLTHVAALEFTQDMFSERCIITKLSRKNMTKIGNSNLIFYWYHFSTSQVFIISVSRISVHVESAAKSNPPEIEHRQYFPANKAWAGASKGVKHEAWAHAPCKKRHSSKSEIRSIANIMPIMQCKWKWETSIGIVL